MNKLFFPSPLNFLFSLLLIHYGDKYNILLYNNCKIIYFNAGLYYYTNIVLISRVLYLGIIYCCYYFIVAYCNYELY